MHLHEALLAHDAAIGTPGVTLYKNDDVKRGSDSHQLAPLAYPLRWSRIGPCAPDGGFEVTTAELQAMMAGTQRDTVIVGDKRNGHAWG